MLKTLGALALMLTAGFQAIIVVFTVHVLLRWFVPAAQFHPGMGELFGLCMAGSFLIGVSILPLQRKEDEDSYAKEHPFLKLLATYFGVALGAAIILGVSFLTGEVLGWIV